MVLRSRAFINVPTSSNEVVAMLFIVSGRDKTGGIAARLDLRTQHRAYYAALGDDLVLAGP